MKFSKTWLIIVIIFISNFLIAQNNGFVKEYLEFTGSYIGTINNSPCFLFYEKGSQKGQITQKLKIYDEDLTNFKEETIPFYRSDVNAKIVDNMILNSYLEGNIEIDKQYKYGLFRMELYGLDNLTKPKYSLEYDPAPNFPFTSLKDKNYIKLISKLYHTNNRTVSIHSFYFKPRKSFDIVSLSKKYMVVTNEKLEILFKGFIDLDLEDEIIDQVHISNSNIFLITKHKNNHFQDIFHLMIDNGKIVSTNKIQIPENYCYDFQLSISPDKKNVGLSFYYNDIKPENATKRVSRYRGDGLAIYNIESKAVEKIKFYPFTKLIKYCVSYGDNTTIIPPRVAYEEDGKIYYNAGVGNIFAPYWINDKIVLIKTKLSYTSGSNTMPTNNEYYTSIYNNLPCEFTLKIINKNLEIDFEKEYNISVAAIDINSNVNNFSILYDEAKSKLNILYFNYSLREEEDNVVSDDEKGSHLIQLSYNNDLFSKSYIDLPENSKYFNRGRGMVTGQNRDHYFTLSPFQSYNNYLIINIDKYKDKNNLMYYIKPND